MRLFLEQRHELQTIHVGEIQLEQDQIRMMLCRLPEAPFASNRDHRPKTGKHNLLDQQLGIVRLLFDDKYGLSALTDHFLKRPPTIEWSNNHASQEGLCGGDSSTGECTKELPCRGEKFFKLASGASGAEN